MFVEEKTEEVVSTIAPSKIGKQQFATVLPVLRLIPTTQGDAFVSSLLYYSKSVRLVYQYVTHLTLACVVKYYLSNQAIIVMPAYKCLSVYKSVTVEPTTPSETCDRITVKYKYKYTSLFIGLFFDLKFFEFNFEKC